MSGPHADGEDLAQLAMQSPVPPEVAAHVATCPECSKDLSLLKSLLAAEGPDAESTEVGATALPDAVPVLDDAMADGNDSRQGSEHVDREPSGANPEDSETNHGAARSGINAAALVAALVIFVGAALLAFFALR